MNIKVTDKPDKLVIEIPKNNPLQLSASGKSHVVASTRGNIDTGILIDGKPVKLGLNAYIPVR